MATVQDLVKYLRLNLNIQDSTVSTPEDVELLDLTDEDLLLYLNIVLTRDFPGIESLEDIESQHYYPLMLLAKKELYFALATSSAPLYKMEADDGSLSMNQKFDHYMKLIAEVDKLYTEFNENGGAGGLNNTLTSFDVLLSERYFTQRNYDKGIPPALYLYVDNVSSTAVEIHWKPVNVSRFYMYKVYISNSLIYDEYALIPDRIQSGAILVSAIRDAKQTTLRIEDLTPNTTYHLMVSVTEYSSLMGVKEITFTTEVA